MKPANESTPTVAATTTGAKEQLGMQNLDKNDTSKPVELHLPHRVAGRLTTWGNCDLPDEKRRSVFINAGDYVDLADNTRPARLCETCVDAAVAHATAKKRQEEQRRRERERVEQARRRRIREEELRLDLVEAHRAGNDAEVTRLLDALVAEDNAALAALGKTSWGEVSDDE